MAAKQPILGDPMEFSPVDLFQVQRSDGADRPSPTDMAVFRSAIGARASEASIQQLPAEMLDVENYRIGLVPLKSLNNHASTPYPARVSSVLVLPMTWKELVFRVRAEVRQTAPTLTEETVRIGDVTIDFSCMEATRSGVAVHLTTLQFKLLRYLVENPRRVISREELLNRVWGFNNYPTTRTVDTFMLRLRQHFEPDPASPVYFHTVHRGGYKFVP